MRWGEVVEALIAELEADASLLALLGGESRIYPSDDPHAGSLPSIGYTVVTDEEEENLESVRIQWDIFGTEPEVLAIERILRPLVTSRYPKTVQGLAMFLIPLAGRTLPSPEPGTAHRTFDAIYQPAYEG